MEEEKLFEKEGDLIPDFFGQQVIVLGILPKTDTLFDNFPGLVIDNSAYGTAVGGPSN